MRTRSSWIWCWIVVEVLASGAGAQQYTTIIDNLPTCTGNRNGRVISVSDAVSDADCTEGGATGEDRFVHPCICDTLNALGPYWKAVGGGAGSSGPADALAPAVVIEGTTADAFEGNFTFADPTVDWTCAWSATGQISCPPGTSLLPTYSFGADTNTGFYSSGGDVVGLALGGGLKYEWYTDGMQFYSGVGIIGTGVAGNTIVGMLNSVEATTSGSGAPNVLLGSESRKVLTNEGSSAENYHTLPAAVTGLEYTFVVQDTDGIRITAAAGDTIQPIAGTAASGAGGFIRCATAGAFIRLVAINATEWVAVGSAGVWTIDV